MITISFPNLSQVKVTEDTLKLNKSHWNGNMFVNEVKSIDYVYKSVLETIKKNGKARLIDIGAQEGLFSLYFNSLDLVRVDSYEPCPISYKCLADNITLNGCKYKIVPYNFAITNYKGRARLKFSETEPFIKTLAQKPIRFNKFHETEVMTDTLDNLYAARKVDFIRCSSEGSEYFILKGALKILKRDKPNLLITFNETAMREFNVRSKDLFDMLKDLGYKEKEIIDYENIVFSVN